MSVLRRAVVSTDGPALPALPLALAAALATLGGCSSEPPPPPPIALTVGVHDVALHVPEGWLHFDHGGEQRFQRDIAQIALADVGPVTPEGYLREIEHARELFRKTQLADARTKLGSLSLRGAFSSEQQWQRFEGSWRVVADAGRKPEFDPGRVEAAYDAVLAQIDALPTPDLAVLVERALPDLHYGTHRAVAESQPVMIDGRPGMRVETWDRLSHDHRKSYLFVLNEGNLLVARMELGQFAEMQAAFEALVDSLEIHPRPMSISES